ncbi:acyl-CoA dehydrogenase [Gordonia sp. HY002]|uniref:acyl-CoA dehydrogenase n=1 Tax=Gordonia zhenghanii TaxID=2911516 RepID=UPI001EF04D1B|nr:acyl-CoA dehydrogenase [Gordonia zhenghanii]MCF8568983.1 acyl-CoA dehydrogenase [Gordonia zhenghanii]MCF8606954.1 acyl-CoA dehydrogenase [Gordonia zhenghanii]
MTIATSSDQQAVYDSVTEWAAAKSVVEAVRADVDDAGASWRAPFAELGALGIFGAAVDESRNGAGGTFIDVAVMLEACGASLVPGPLAPTVAAAYVTASQGAAEADSLLGGEQPVVTPAAATATGAPFVVVDGAVDLGPVPGWTDGVAVAAPFDFGDGDARWWLIDASTVTVDAAAMDGPLDGTAVPRRVRLSGVDVASLVELGPVESGPGETFVAVLTLGIAAYQAGVARHALDVAVDYAKVRTQFGSPIGSFQAIKQICADMLTRSEQLAAAAWDLASALEAGEAEQARLSRLAAAVLVADLAPANTKDAIQVLGGIGFTFEHDAHLYLRSALAARMLLGQGSGARAELAQLGRKGMRREFSLDLDSVQDRRPEIAAAAEEVAAAPESERRAALARTGLLAPHWPEPYGLGAGPALQLLIDTELDRVGVVRPDLVIAGWALPTILEHGTDAQREKFVSSTLAGDIRWCQLFSEPEAGSDLASLRTRAVRTDGGWLLTGQKIWTSEAHMSQWAVCLARTDADAPKHKGITYFLVDMAAAGIDIRPLRELTGRAMFNEVFLDEVFVPDEMVVGEINGGWRLARTTLANERVAMGGSGLGKEVDALLTQIDGVDLDAEQTGVLGGIIADAHIGRVLDARAVVQRLSGTDPGVTSSVRKLIGVVHRQAVPEFATDLLGVEALASTTATELLLLNRCLSIAGGTTQILKNAAAERILGLPRG